MIFQPKIDENSPREACGSEILSNSFIHPQSGQLKAFRTNLRVDSEYYGNRLLILVDNWSYNILEANF